MTEFKKLGALVDSLRCDVEALEAATSSDQVSERCTDTEIVALQDTATRVKNVIADATPRVRKIVFKARETDPNKQIYNEAMCDKIEALFRAYRDLIVRLYPLLLTMTLAPADGQGQTAAEHSHTDSAAEDAVSLAILEPQMLQEDVLAFENAPRLEAVEDAYNAYTLRVAHAEVWQARVALKLDDAALFEEQGRAVVIAEEKMARTALVESKRQGKLHIQSVLREREEMRWRAEQERRTREHAALQRLASTVAPQSCDAFIHSSLPAAYHKSLASHLRGLVKALSTTPEDVNIRKLRNNNAQFLCDFGNRGLVMPRGEDESDCVCATFAHTSEVILYRIGYRLRYTAKGSPSPVFLVAERIIEDTMLPCGEPVSRHMYRPVGFEEYSERYLELSEPDAMRDADAWMTWYTSLHEIEASLQRLT